MRLASRPNYGRLVISWLYPRSALMRIAILSDIHGNQTAFEAVLADLTSNRRRGLPSVCDALLIRQEEQDKGRRRKQKCPRTQLIREIAHQVMHLVAVNIAF